MSPDDRRAETMTFSSLERDRYKALLTILLTTEFPTAAKGRCGRRRRAARPFPYSLSGRLYEILMPSSSNQDRNLISAGGRTPCGPGGVMLDLAFVALGFALIGVMGLYAVGLRKL